MSNYSLQNNCKEQKIIISLVYFVISNQNKSTFLTLQAVAFVSKRRQATLKYPLYSHMFNSNFWGLKYFFEL